MTFLSSAWRKPALLAVRAALFTSAPGILAATPQAWFKADSISGANGAAVPLWIDSSGSGFAATAATAPTLATAALNGLPLVHFSGAQSLAFTRPVQGDFSFMVLFRTSAGNGTDNNFYSGSGIVSAEVPGVTDDFGISMRGGGRVMAGTGNPDTTIRNTNGNYADGNPHILTFVRTQSTGALKLYVDGSTVANGSGGTQSLTAPSQITIGSQPGAYNFLTGDIGEILVYGVPLTATEQVAAEDALRGKYGLSNGAAPVAPTNAVANGARVGWTESVGAKTYRIERSAAADAQFTVIAANATGNYYVDPSPLQGVSNFYRVTAVNPIGSSGPSNVAEGISPVLPANGKVVINEIHYNGLNNAVHSDFVELYNFNDSATDIGGWTLNSGIEYTFAPGTVMAPGAYLVIAQDPTVVQALWGATALGPYAKALSSDGDTVQLKDAAGQTVGQLTYSSGFPWPCAANGNGASAELVNPALDNTLGSSWRASVMTSGQLTTEVASPGAQNYQFRLNAAPNIEAVSNDPQQPAANVPVTVTARLGDDDGVAGATLSYQIVTPGNHIPASLPLPIVNHLIDTTQPLPANPEFEKAANWTTISMYDDGTNGDAVAHDGIYTAVIPPQAHRTLVRYRVTATDGQGLSVRAPFDDDASKNFAYFVYNGVPDYQSVPSATLTTLPVYQFLTRKADYDQCVAYNSTDQLAGGTPTWTFENWEATLVFEGKVYDHIRYRLHGGNGRYYFNSKRAFRFFFNSGYDFQNRDNDGKLSATKWNSLTTENGWENLGTLTYSLNEVVNFHLWNLVGIPSPQPTWIHFRTITTAAEQADPAHGDFWGLMMIHEDYDRRFIDNHAMDKGNLYKLTRDATDGEQQLRYQASDSVSDGSDHDNIYRNMTPDKDVAFVNRYVNFDRWSVYHAICEAVRHYDYWPEGDNNETYYFAPDYTGQTDHLGKLWVLPNDVDATWGPTWNQGHDRVYSAVFDSPGKPAFYPAYFNAVREVRDLLFQQDQINPMIDHYAGIISPFMAADSLRWKNAPADAGNYNGLGGAGIVSLSNLVADMKKFAWTGGNWPSGDAGAGVVGAGGRAAFLDTLQLGVSNSEGATMPAKPTATYQGPAGYASNSLSFGTSAFSDPQGAMDFAAVQWRVAEVTDATAPAYSATAPFMPEWTAAFDSGPLTTFASSYTFPAGICKAGHSYRVRVRHEDITGRWSHWSDPVAFIAGASTVDATLEISEFLYKPHNPSAAEIAAGFSDQEQFEYVELRNVGSQPFDLGGVTFDKGITFVFPAGSSLAAGASTVITPNLAAFNFRYGTDRNVAGVYTGSLKNSGERILVLSATGASLVDFTYSDSAPWPTEADTDGRSLVLIDPASKPDPDVAANWRASRDKGGAPGVDDDVSFDIWAVAKGVTGGMSGDDDGDGISNALEYALATDPKLANPSLVGVMQTLTVDGVDGSYLTVTFTRLVDAEDLQYNVETSTDLSTWSATAVRMGSVEHYDGTVTETWRTPAPIAGGAQGFLRVRLGGS